jgi:LacI family transcriptional regulator
VSQPRREPRVTLADVARLAGVSTTTASFVLAGRTDMRISTQTTDNVRRAARVLDYRPRVGGRVTLMQKRPAVGFISDTIASEPFAGELIRGGIAEAARQGHTVVVAETGGGGNLEAGLIQELLDGGVETFLYAVTATRNVRLPDALLDTRTVLVNCIDRRWRLTSVVPDDRSGGALAAETLVEAGHGDRIWLAGEIGTGPFAGRERYAGIVKRLAKHGLVLANHVDSKWWPPETRTAMVQALSGAALPPTGVIAMNDRAAMGVYQAATEAGLRIPDDLSVVSFDNSDLAWWLAPGLTSIALPYYEIGSRAMAIALGAQPRARVERLAMPRFDRAAVAAPAA